jgi:invasion protein IalB
MLAPTEVPTPMSRSAFRLLAVSAAGCGVVVAAVAMGMHVHGALAQTPPAASNPPPPVSAEPQVTTASYADWTLRCQRTGDAPQSPRQCEVSQSVQAQQATILQVAFARANPKQPFRLVAVVPVNVSFASVPRVSITDKDPAPVNLSWLNCTPGGCAAEANVSDELMKQWRAQTERGRVQVKDSAGRDVAIPFSFRGLAQALDALAKI